MLLRCMARNALYINKELFSSMAWTAHGAKIWDGPGTLSYTMRGDLPVQAMPELESIFSMKELSLLVTRLSEISIHQFETSITFVRDVRRVPLKSSSESKEELQHQSQSFDGLGRFYPYDIYPSNIALREGLLEALARIQAIDEFGLADSSRPGKYSILLADVAIFWQLFRLLYIFTGFAPIRHDLFLFLGLWHTYQHCHKLIWSEFRSTFLADSFFTLFPNDSLLFAPKLLQSQTFFHYLRLSFPSWRGVLLSTISTTKKLMLKEQMEFLEQLGEWKSNQVTLR